MELDLGPARSCSHGGFAQQLHFKTWCEYCFQRVKWVESVVKVLTRFRRWEMLDRHRVAVVVHEIWGLLVSVEARPDR